MTLFSLVDCYQHFRGVYCFIYNVEKWSSKALVLFVYILGAIISQKTLIIIFFAMRTTDMPETFCSVSCFVKVDIVLSALWSRRYIETVCSKIELSLPAVTNFIKVCLVLETEHADKYDFHISHVWVTIDGVSIGIWIYCTLTYHNYKYLERYH
jgi:hypothetical protein